MKKILLCAVALALPLLFSCNKDNKDASIPTGASFSSSSTFSADGVFATFNADNTYLAGTNGTKAIAKYQLVWGTYTFENGVYTMYYQDTQNIWGTLEKVNGNTVKVTIGKEEPMTVQNVTITTPAAGNESANHTWKAVGLTLVYKGATFNSPNGVDLNAFETWAKGLKLIEKESFEPQMVVNKVILSDCMVSFLFENGQTFVARIPDGANWSDFTMNQFAVEGTDNLPVFQGKTSISFTAGGNCLIAITGTYQDQEAKAVLTLSL